MDDTALGKPPSFDGKVTLPINTAVDTRETSIFESRQKYRKEISLVEHVLARRLGAKVNEHHRAIREMDKQVMPQIQYTDKVAYESVVVQRQVSPRTSETKPRIFKLTVNTCKQRIFKLTDLAQEIIGVKGAQKTCAKLLDDASTKEAVADDTANSNSLTHSPSQSWSKETKRSGFEESVGNLTNDQDSAKMREMWITAVNLGRHSTVM